MATRRDPDACPNHSDVQSLTQAIQSLHSRLGRTEGDFQGHLRKVEDRLDQIIDLTKNVAILQTNTTQQNESLTELRTQVREGQAKTDTSITRLHTRIDDLNNSIRDGRELFVREQDMKVSLLRQEQDKRIGEVEAAHTKVAKEFYSWLNKGLGAWGIASVLAVGSTFFFHRWIDKIDREGEHQVSKVQNLQQDSRDMTIRMQNVEVLLKEVAKSQEVSRTQINELTSIVVRGPASHTPYPNNGTTR